jgi:hypothetical protein
MVYQDPRSLMILERITDGTGLEKQLSLPSPDPLLPSSLDPSGQIMAITLVGSTNEIYLMTPGEDPKLFERDASTPAISPDGRWIAYSSPAVGNSNVYVRPVNGPGKWQVSPEIGGYPRWSRDGKELYYLGTGVTQRPLIVVPVESSENFSAGPPRVLIPDLSRYMTATAPQLDWDAAPSGDHFIFIEVERALDEGTRIDVSLYWGKHIAVPGTGQ